MFYPNKSSRLEIKEIYPSIIKSELIAISNKRRDKINKDVNSRLKVLFAHMQYACTGSKSLFMQKYPKTKVESFDKVYKSSIHTFNQ